MARMIPAGYTSSTVSPGEVSIFKCLKDEALASDWTVLHSLDIAEHKTQLSGELDFVVCVPNLGILCLEVKACHSVSREEGAWYYGNDPKPDFRGPFKQVENAKFSILKYLKQNLGDKISVPIFSAVAFTHLDFHEISPEWHQWQIINKEDIDNNGVSNCIRNVLLSAREHFSGTGSGKWVIKSSGPDKTSIDQVVKKLRPKFEYFESPSARKARHFQEIKNYTEEQFDALETGEINSRMAYVGPAGTGKTLLCIEAVRRATERGERVLFLCYNDLLSEFLQSQVRPLGNTVVCGTIDSFMLKLANVKPQTQTNFWKKDLPKLAFDCRGNIQPFDFLVIDEAQDILNSDILAVLDGVMKGGLKNTKVHLFGDFHGQSVHGTEITLTDLKNKWMQDLAIFPLTKNCRNTPRIAKLGSSFMNGVVKYKSVLRPDDYIEPITHFYSNSMQQSDFLLQALGEYKKQGIHTNEIAILSCHTDGGATQDIINTFSNKKSYDTNPNILPNGLVCTTIRKFKGLERYGVIITDIENAQQSHFHELLYIATTRSIGRLTLIAERGVSNILTKRMN
jgi:hypothetical protein